MNTKNLSDQVDRKFIESYSVDDYEILTDTGWEDISAIHKTVPYEKWTIETKNYKLSAADTHILFNENLEEVFLKDLKPGDKILTETESEEVISIENNNIEENMYDITVESENHRFYSNRYFIT
jgi:hypothetical protein